MSDFFNPLLGNIWVLCAVLVVGFFLLVKGADWLVDGAIGVAKRFKVSDLVIGLTVVAFGTSMPEFVVNILSASQGHSEMAITNVLGSNAINIFVILGLTALIYPISSTKEARRDDIPFTLLGSLLVLLLAGYTFPAGFTFHPGADSVIDRMEGLVLLLLFAVYLYLLARRTKQNKESEEAYAEMSIKRAVLLVFIGLFGLSVGGELIVDSATRMAQHIGVSDAIIGLTIVALGTSLPELATSVMAARKHNADLALGNCIGSCTFNIFFVLAASAAIHPLTGYEGLTEDALMALMGPALCYVFVCVNKDKKITRAAGAMLLLIYAIYLGLRIYQL